MNRVHNAVFHPELENGGTHVQKVSKLESWEKAKVSESGTKVMIVRVR